MAKDCQQSDYKETCDADEQWFMGNVTCILRTMLFAYFAYVHHQYLEAAKMQQPYQKEDLEMEETI